MIFRHILAFFLLNIILLINIVHADSEFRIANNVKLYIPYHTKYHHSKKPYITTIATVKIPITNNIDSIAKHKFQVALDCSSVISRLQSNSLCNSYDWLNITCLPESIKNIHDIDEAIVKIKVYWFASNLCKKNNKLINIPIVISNYRGFKKKINIQVVLHNIK